MEEKQYIFPKPKFVVPSSELGITLEISEETIRMLEEIEAQHVLAREYPPKIIWK